MEMYVNLSVWRYSNSEYYTIYFHNKVERSFSFFSKHGFISGLYHRCYKNFGQNLITYLQLLRFTKSWPGILSYKFLQWLFFSMPRKYHVFLINTTLPSLFNRTPHFQFYLTKLISQLKFCRPFIKNIQSKLNPLKSHYSNGHLCLTFPLGNRNT